MLKIGKYNQLRVLKQEGQGFYLDGDEEWGSVLLPNKRAPKNLKVEDQIEVFIYFDSDDVVIATTQRPFAVVGEYATLKVKAVEEFGVFLDWGLDKDLFVPFREQIFKMVEGESYVVYPYIDSSGRIAASTRVNKFLSKTPMTYSEGEQVSLRLFQSTDMGVKAIINGQHEGLIYKDDIFSYLNLGDVIPGYIKSVRDDGKIDLLLRLKGSDNRENLADQIIQKLIESNGFLEVNAKTPADVIYSMFNVSRNKFKVALGYLYKQKLITTDESGTRLINKDS